MLPNLWWHQHCSDDVIVKMSVTKNSKKLFWVTRILHSRTKAKVFAYYLPFQNESAELRAPRASCSTCPLALHVSCLTCSRASCASYPMCSGSLCALCLPYSRWLVPYVLRALRAPVFHVSRASHASCLALSLRTLLFRTLRTLDPNITFFANEFPCITLPFFCSFAKCDFLGEIY